MPAYYLNQKTHKYHIDGFCQYNSPTGNLRFETEKELLDYTGGQALICKICQKKRDKSV